MRPGHCLVACSVLALSTLLPLSPLHAADIYRWVDENGQTHLSDTVPDQYRNSATRVDTGPTELTPEQQREAQDRAVREKARADAEAQSRARGVAPDAGGGTAPAAPAPAVKRAPPATTSDSNCAELLRRYRESQECFAPYRMANGAIRPEGFQLCGPAVPDPSGSCVRVNPD